MWSTCLTLSIFSVLLLGISAQAWNWFRRKSGSNLFCAMFAGVFLAAFFLFLPIRLAAEENVIAVMLSLFNAMQVFTLGAEYSIISGGMAHCDQWLREGYQVWATAVYVLAPIFTFGFVMSLFKNLSAYGKYLCMFFKKVYVFSDLNEQSLALATDIKRNHPRAGIVFHDVFDGKGMELIGRAGGLGAVCFRKDILSVRLGFHDPGAITFFTIGSNETENLNQTIGLIEKYRKRRNTHVYVFSTKLESELLLTALPKGKIKVRRINQVQSLINRVLYERGQVIFESAIATEDGIRDISAVVVGMGNHGTEMVKALSWFGQMNGYRIKIDAFDKNPLAEDTFRAMAPELMSPEYNGVWVDGEAQYTIQIHSGRDVETAAFTREINQLKKATYVFVSLGDDDRNIRAAVNLRMLFERMGIHPMIQAVLTNSQQKKALTGIRNYRGQPYDITFIGDIEASYAENVIIDSELEEDALQRHLKWGKEEEFWGYEYNYRSSVASAIHMRARIKCGIPGAEKKEEDLTPEEQELIEALEHRRWNAYMRAEGYVYSGSKDKTSRNDLAKMHHDLVDFASLPEEEKRKDSRVGSQ